MDLIAEALRLNDRYLREVVLAFGLCPWAEHAISAGQVRRIVITDELTSRVGADAPAEALAFVDELEGPAAAGIEIGLVIFPRFAGSPGDFDRFTERLRQADRARRAPGVLPAFVAAAFHPDAPADFENPWQLVAVIRRSPDPTIQLVRNATLEAARRTAPRVSDDVTERNFATVSPDPERLHRAVAAIRSDRDETYARLGR